MNYNIKIRQLHDPNTIVLLDGENRKREYTYDPNSDPNHWEYRNTTDTDYSALVGRYDVIVEDSNGTWVIVKKHGGELHFDINGNLTAITDRHENSITFTYNANGLLPLYGPSEFFVEEEFGGPSDGRGLVAMAYKLTTITNDLGRQINLSYNNDGLLETVTDFADRTWTYDYNSVTNDLISVTTPSTDEYNEGLKTAYEYDDNHHLIKVTDPNGQIWLENTYDANDTVVEQKYGDGTFEFTYDPNSG